MTRRYTIGANKPKNRGGRARQRETNRRLVAGGKICRRGGNRALTELELSEYCRHQGLYPEQIRRWKDACIQGAQKAEAHQQQQRLEAKQDKQRIKALEKELNRKEKALAEAAALLVLRKKLTALWEANEAD